MDVNKKLMELSTAKKEWEKQNPKLANGIKFGLTLASIAGVSALIGGAAAKLFNEGFDKGYWDGFHDGLKDLELKPGWDFAIKYKIDGLDLVPDDVVVERMGNPEVVNTFIAKSGRALMEASKIQIDKLPDVAREAMRISSDEIQNGPQEVWAIIMTGADSIYPTE